MIKEIHLFTNRNTLFFDENGEQLSEYQDKFSWAPCRAYDDSWEQPLKEVIEAKPRIWLCNWGSTTEDTWRHEINVDKFCSLFGYGPWYVDYKKEQEEMKNPLDIAE